MTIKIIVFFNVYQVTHKFMTNELTAKENIFTFEIVVVVVRTTTELLMNEQILFFKSFIT